MRFPKVRRDENFDLKMDSSINSKVFKRVDAIMSIVCDRDPLLPDYDGRGAGLLKLCGKDRDIYEWGVRIKDQHLNEAKPHYIYGFGVGNYERGKKWVFETPYEDKHSRAAEKGDIGRAIGEPFTDEDPGRWTIEIWIPGFTEEDAGFVTALAKDISFIYDKAMEESLPDYGILSRRTELKVPTLGLDECSLNGETSYVCYFDADNVAWIKGVSELQDEGFYATKRPHRKLPSLIRYWARLLRQSGESTIWMKRKVGEKDVVWALAGCHPVGISDGKETWEENHYVLRTFGKWDIERNEGKC